MQQSLFNIERNTGQADKTVTGKAILNPAQYEAMTCSDGPVLVIAGAGSGKTRTLVYRVAYLLEQGVAPESILLLTFTRKASQEMLDRASHLMDDSCRQVVGGTFHSVANLLLRRYGHYLGYQPNFTILDRSDAEGIINLLKSSLGFGGAGKRFPTKRMIINIFSRTVNKDTSIDDVVHDQYPHLLDNLSDLEVIAEHYRAFKMEHGLMDYDDLLVNFKKLLADFPDVREEIAARFTHILVDEYQDTNPVQALIVRMLAHGHNNVMVVGDDAQSIYRFRGADFRNIIDFPKLFPGARIIRLEENYRSTQKILAVANSIIEHAAEKYTKTLFSNIEGGVHPQIYNARDESEQSRFICRQIEELHNEGMPYSRIAVLFRSGFHSYKLELELANRQIEFDKRGGLKLTESAHIKDVISYLRLVSNPMDNLSWNRVLLLLDKVGPKTAQSMLDAIKSCDDPFEVLAQYTAGKSWKKGLQELLKMLGKLRKPNLSPSGMFDLLLDYYQPLFERIYHDDYPRRQNDLKQLGLILGGYESLQSFIDDTALDPPDTTGNDPGQTDGENTLILSTIHSAKGLEWDAVFVIHLAEGKFPSCQPYMTEEWEEERRLLYVAATRAKKNLYFTYPREMGFTDRFASGGRMSPFLEEIPTSLLQSSAKAPFAGKGTAKAVHDFVGSRKKADSNDLAEGMVVRHAFFGEGTVEKKVGPKTFEIHFARHGRKKLHLDYAKLEIVGKRP